MLDAGEVAGFAERPGVRRHLVRALSGVLLERLPTGVRSGRVDPGRRGMAVLLLVAVTAVLGAGVVVWRSRPTAVSVPVVRESSRPATARPALPPTAISSPVAGGQVTVDVAGKVRQPGVVNLPAGSRVQDAIAAAGGVLTGEDAGAVNLARRLSDGEQVVVGASTAAGAASASPPGSPALAKGNGKVDLNAATHQDLDSLPGVGPVLAQRILAWRGQHGRFASVAQLREVGGIGERMFADISPLVTV